MDQAFIDSLHPEVNHLNALLNVHAELLRLGCPDAAAELEASLVRALRPLRSFVRAACVDFDSDDGEDE